MRSLKLFLYIILSACIMWGITIIFGPALITKLTEYYSNGRVILTDVNVSPRFDVSIGEIDMFSINDENGLQSKSTARAVTIKLMKIFSSPSVEISTGFADVLGFGSIRSFQLFLKFKNFYDLSTAKLEFKGNHVDLSKSVLVKELFGNAQINFSQQKASNLEFNFRELSDVDKAQLSIPELTLMVDKYIFNQNVKDQVNFIEVRASQLNLIEQELLAEGLGVKVLKDGALTKLDVSVETLDFNKGQVLGKQLVLENNLTLEGIGNEKTAVFNVSKLVVPNIDLEMSEISGVLSGSKTFEVVSVDGHLDSYDLSLGEMYVGMINNGEFSMYNDFIYSLNGLSVKTEWSFKTISDPVVSVKVNSKSDILVPNSLGDCFQSKCFITGIFADYAVVAGSEKIVGSFQCPKANCFSSSSKHRFQTLNTNNFFYLLSKTRILSPVFLAILYREVIKGVEVKGGHKFGFD